MLSLGQASAAAPQADAEIVNVATVGYTVGNKDYDADATARFRIAQLLDLSLICQTTPMNVLSGEVNVVSTYLLTNVGNGLDTFELTLDNCQTNRDEFDPQIVSVWLDDGDDISYQFSLSNDDYLVVAERNGNSELSIQALNAAGAVIPGSQILVFKTGGNTFFEWDTGFRSQEDGNTNQTLELGVVDISQFGTNDNVFGLRVINNSGADNKIFVASDDPFTDNPPNPTPLPIFTVLKSARVDNGTLTAGDDFYVPSAEVIYRVTVTNSGGGSPDADSFTFTDTLPNPF